MHRAIDGDGVQQVHVGARRVPNDGARPAQAPHEGRWDYITLNPMSAIEGLRKCCHITQRVHIPKDLVCMGA